MLMLLLLIMLRMMNQYQVIITQYLFNGISCVYFYIIALSKSITEIFQYHIYFSISFYFYYVYVHLAFR